MCERVGGRRSKVNGAFTRGHVRSLRGIVLAPYWIAATLFIDLSFLMTSIIDLPLHFIHYILNLCFILYDLCLTFM